REHHVRQVNLAAKHSAFVVGLDQERPELLAEPEVTVAIDADGFDVEVCARQQAALDDRRVYGDGAIAVRVRRLVSHQAETEASSRITQADEAVAVEARQRASRTKIRGRDGAGAATSALRPDREIRLDRVNA